jgi:hypothetical protein
MSQIVRPRIRYNVTIEDLVAFNVFYARTSPTIRSLQRRYRMITLPIVFLMTFVIELFTRHHLGIWYPLIVASITTLALAVYLNYYYKSGYLSRLRHTARKLYSENKNPGVVGEHILEVDEQGFINRTEFKEARYAWGALVRIESEPNYTYLFTGPGSAFVIPHQSLIEGDFPSLLEQIRLHYKPDQALAST